MLRRHRRFFALLGFLLIATPLIWGMVLPDSPDLILKEGRRPTPTPAAPESLAGLAAFPGEIDAYLKDHFGLRHAMIRLHKDLAKPVLFKENNVVVYGDDGRLFALGDDMVLQSAGQLLRGEKVAETANMLADMNDALTRRGIKFLVAVPPNSSTIYQDDLPKWAKNPGKRTEYDALLDELSARRIKAVDLRPPLRSARLSGPAYLMNDLHWNVRGAVAAFNAIVDADGRPDWRVDPSSAIGPLAEHKGGDIARLLGIEDSVTEVTEALALPSPGTTVALSGGPEGRVGAAKDMTDHMIVSGKPGPTILVIGDSFTTDYFPTFLAQHGGRAIWIHHQYCGFDWSWIEKLKPDEVWWTPVERFLVCAPGQYPRGLSRDAAFAD
jgi:alginate O-acetyltransferase complex protein AlgJ